LTKEGTGYRIHVVAASTGRELKGLVYDGPYTWAGWDVPPVGLTGDFVVIGFDNKQQVVNWRTGKRMRDVPGTQLPSTGGGRTLGSESGGVTYRLGDSSELRSTQALAVSEDHGKFHWAINDLAPNGRFVETSNTMVAVDGHGHVTEVFSGLSGKVVKNPVVYVTDVATGHRVTLPGTARTYGWTPDGRLMRVDGNTVTTCDATSGTCIARTMPSGPGVIRMAGRYLGS
jgi:hypothetical protein